MAPLMKTACLFDLLSPRNNERRVARTIGGWGCGIGAGVIEWPGSWGALRREADRPPADARRLSQGAPRPAPEQQSFLLGVNSLLRCLSKKDKWFILVLARLHNDDEIFVIIL
jgi:hypothetical protein